MRKLSVFIEMNGENVYVGEISGKDSTERINVIKSLSETERRIRICKIEN